MPPVTCHILDTSKGKPAEGVVVAIYRLGDLPEGDLVIDEQAEPFGLAKTNKDGRVTQWVFAPTKDLSSIGIKDQEWSTLVPGVYRIRFQTGKYFNNSSFFPFIDVLFNINNPPDNHYHIPLLLSGHSYTTYRGS